MAESGGVEVNDDDLVHSVKVLRLVEEAPVLTPPPPPPLGLEMYQKSIRFGGLSNDEHPGGVKTRHIFQKRMSGRAGSSCLKPQLYSCEKSRGGEPLVFSGDDDDDGDQIKVDTWEDLLSSTFSICAEAFKVSTLPSPSQTTSPAALLKPSTAGLPDEPDEKSGSSLSLSSNASGCSTWSRLLGRTCKSLPPNEWNHPERLNSPAFLPSDHPDDEPVNPSLPPRSASIRPSLSWRRKSKIWASTSASSSPKRTSFSAKTDSVHLLRAPEHPSTQSGDVDSRFFCRKTPIHRLYLSAVRRLIGATGGSSRLRLRSCSESSGDWCPVCQMPFDKGKKRKLVDTSCGHERCYACMFRNEACPLCLKPGSSPAKLKKAFASETPPTINRQDSFILGTHNYSSPAKSSVVADSAVDYDIDGEEDDDDEGATRGKSTLHSLPRPYRTFGSSLRADQLSSGGASTCTPVSGRHNRAGFQSSPSLATLEQSALFDGTTKRRVHHTSSSISSSSTASSASINGRSRKMRDGGGSKENDHFLIKPRNVLSSSNELRKKNSLSSQEDSGSFRHPFTYRRSAAKMALCSSKPADHNDESKSLGFRQPYWTLKPLFFEVPNGGLESLIGRQWLYREIGENLSSDLPTNRGVIINGAPGTGKTAIILALVKQSCFGRNDSLYQEAPSQCPAGGAAAAEGPEDFGLSEGIYSGGCSYTLSRASHPRRGQVVRKLSVDNLKTLASQVVAYHFCQADNAPTCHVAEFVHSVAAQMSQSPKLTPYYHRICSSAELQGILSLPGCLADPNRAFVQGILEPLNELKRLGKISGQEADTCLLIIDGLCAAEIHRPDYGDTLITFLSRHLLKFPHWLKVVCTVRSDQLDITKMLPFQKISLDKIDVDERLSKDMSEYIAMRIARSSNILTNITPISVKSFDSSSTSESRFSQFMVQASKGSFLYSKMVLDLIERGHLVIKSATSFNVLPLSLSEVFTLECNLKFPSANSFDKVRQILCVALSSLTPLTAMEMYQSVNALNSCPSGLSWGEFLMRFSALNSFLVRRADDSYMFFHPFFKEWLIRRENSNQAKFLCDPRLGHAAIALRMSRMEAPLSPEKTMVLGHHILKAHLYKNVPLSGSIPARDLQAEWVSLSTDDASLALGCVRNAASPNVKVSRLLLLAGASPDFITEFLDESPLIGVFSHYGYLSMISLLLEFGADVNSVNGKGLSALMMASKQGHLEVVRFLLQNGATINLVDKQDVSALIHATRSGFLNVVGHILGCDWTTDSNHDLGLEESAQQAAVAAAQCGHEHILEFLLDMTEVNINHPDTLTGETPLTAASLSGHKKCCEILLRRGAKVEVCNLREIPALHASILGGNWSLTDLLIREGGPLEQRDAQGRTALMLAAEEGHVAVVELLLSRKVTSVRALDKQGNSALSLACQKGQLRSVKALLEHLEEADLSHMNHSSRTPLHLAAQHGHPEIVQLLLDKGAQMEQMDQLGMRPLDVAIGQDNGAAVQCFLKKGAKLGPKTWSLAKDKRDILIILLNKLLEDGNTLYRRHRLDEAAHRYQYALKRLPLTSGQIKDDHLLQELQIHLLLNLSRCTRKIGDLAAAADFAGQVLQLQPDCVDALQARARAYQESGRVELALADLAHVSRLCPQSRSMKKAILKLQNPSNLNNNSPNNNNNNECDDGEEDDDDDDDEDEGLLSTLKMPQFENDDPPAPHQFPVGSRTHFECIKFVDDGASEFSLQSSSSNKM